MRDRDRTLEAGLRELDSGSVLASRSRWACVAAAASLAWAAGGCTRESVRTAIECQRRANEVEQAVFERMHEGLRVLLYRDATARLAAGSPAGLSEKQEEAIEEAAGWALGWLDERLSESMLRDLSFRLAGLSPKGGEGLQEALARAWKGTWTEVFEARRRERQGRLALEMKARIGEATPVGLSAEQRAAMNGAWNERDLVEFWAIQHERAKALRLAGVDAKLYAEQSVLDLMVKGMQMKGERIVEGAAGVLGEQVSGE